METIYKQKKKRFLKSFHLIIIYLIMGLGYAQAEKALGHNTFLSKGSHSLDWTEKTSSFGNCIIGNTDACFGDVVTYSVANTPGYAYIWSVTNGTATPSGNSVAVTWGNFSSGTISVIVKNNLGAVVDNCSLTVNIHPVPNPIITASYAPDCKGGNGNPQKNAAIGNPKDDECIKACDSSTVVYSTPNNAGSTYTWNVTGAITFIPTGNTVTVDWGAIGIGSISVTETTIFGCTKTTQTCITIIESPRAAFYTLPADVSGLVTVCNNQSVQFVDQSYLISTSTINSWYWTFGDGTSSTLQNPTHVYTYVPGGTNVYTVWLHVENECHCKDSVAIKVIVNPESGPDITCVSAMCENGSAVYSTSASCGTYNWSVSGGTITSPMPYGNTISVNWTTSTGPGIVTLSVSGCSPAALCSSPTSIIVPIIGSIANINGTATACANSVNTYSLNYMPGCIYNWSVTGGGIIISANGNNSINIYWPSGSGGTVTVNYNNPALNCQGIGTLVVQVLPSFTIVGTQNICKPGGVLTYSTSPAAGTFLWEVKDASNTTVFSTTGSTANINWNTLPAGNYQVIATDLSSTYCNSPQNLSIKLVAQPPALTSITGTNPICPNTPYVYTATPSSSSNYLTWTVVGGTPTAGTGNSVSVTWNAVGPYSISVQQVSAAPPGCASAAYTMSVTPIPVVTPTINGALVTCDNILRNYSAAPSNANTYNWTITPNIAGSVIAGQGTANIQVQWNSFSGPAVLAVNAIYCSGSASTSQTISLTPPPPPVINPTGLLCSGQNISFTSPTPAAAFNWNFGDGSPTVTTATGNAPPHIYGSPGPYQVILIVTNPGGCLGTSSVSQYITVLQSPSANLTTPDGTGYCPSDPISTTMTINSQVGNTYLWNGPAFPFTGLTYTATTTGAYNVTVTNANGCSTTSNTIVVVTLPCTPCYIDPSASVSFTNSAPVCNSVNFFGNSTGPIISSSWDFDDPSSGVNNTSGLLNPTHTFSKSGNYLVSFTGIFPAVFPSVGVCKKTFAQAVTIPAVAEFEWKINGCVSTGYSFDFYDKSNYVSPYTITSYNWSFPGGTPSTSASANPTGIILPPGSSTTVSLTITSSGGTTCTKTYNINVPAFPSANFTSPNQVCVGSQITFTSGATGINTWSWNFGDLASSALPNVTTRTYSTPNPTTTVTLNVTDVNGCMASFSKVINVIANTLSASITAAGPTTFCQGNSVNLNSAVSGGTIPYSYLWTNVLAITPSIAANQTGNYTVVVSDANGCLATSNTIAVNVNQAPLPNISGLFNYCLGQVISLNAFQGPGCTYQWNVNGTNYGTTAQLIYYPPVTGNYTIFVTVTGPNGCSATSPTTIVVVNANPAPPIITSSPGGALCAGTPTTLTASGGPMGSTYSWSNGTNGPNTIVNTAGGYSATITNSLGCQSQSYIYVNGLPDLSNLMVGCYEFCDTINGGNGVTWLGPVDPSYSYQWNYNGSPIPGATSANYIIPVLSPGIYTLTVTAYGCSTTSAPIDITFINCKDGCGFTDIIPVSVLCGDIESNGYQTYIMTFTVINPLPSGATFSLSTGGSGSFSAVSPSVLVNGSNTITAVYTDITGTNPIGVGIIINYNNTIVCKAQTSVNLPNCNVSCKITPSIKGIKCSVIDPSGYQTYIVSFGFFWPGNNGCTITGSSSLGTFSNFTPSTVNNGMNYMTAIFTATSPIIPGTFACAIAHIYDPSTGQTCNFKVCGKIPECGKQGACELKSFVKNSKCGSLDPSGYQNYKILLYIDWAGANGSSINIYSANGTINSTSTSTINNGVNYISIDFTNTSINSNGEVCLAYVIYDPIRDAKCKYELCFKLPACGIIFESKGSKIKTLPTDPPNSTNVSEALLNLMPNPAQAQTTITYEFSETTNNRIEVSNMFDQVVKVITLEDSMGSVELNTSQFSAGVYHVIAYNKDQVIISKRLMVLKQ
jgi:PKD repeat protein